MTNKIKEEFMVWFKSRTCMSDCLGLYPVPTTWLEKLFNFMPQSLHLINKDNDRTTDMNKQRLCLVWCMASCKFLIKINYKHNL